MDRRTIVTKTGKGLMEATGKTSNLSRDLRNILKEIDGQVSVSSLLKKLDDLTEPKLLEMLSRMEREGYLREFFGQQDSGPPSRPAMHAPAPPTKVGEDLDFTARLPKAPATGGENAKLNAQAEDIARQAQATRAREDTASKAKAAAHDSSTIGALDRARREAEERARRAAEERSQRVEAERIRIEAEERARKALEEKALREITERSRREDEEKARKQAEERARRETEERVRRELEEKVRREAEERLKRESAERARREQEDRARREAEARSKLEAELRTRLDAEDRARREAEERARYDAQERARREEELRRRADEELRKRRDGEDRRQREEQERREREELERSFRIQEEKSRVPDEQSRQEQERLRREAEERERMEAEVRAAAAAAAAELAAAEKAAGREQEAAQAKEDETTAREEDKARDDADAEATAKARKEARAKEKSEQKERRRTEATARGREPAKVLVTAREAWAKRRPAGLGKMLATGLLVLLIVSIAVLPFVPMDPVPYQKAARAWLDQPVTIGSVNVSFLPLPQLRFEKVAIGRDPQIRIARIRAVPEIGSLLGDKIALKSLDLEGLVFPKPFLSALLSAGGRGESLHVERITAKGVKLDVANLALPPLDVEAKLAPNGALQSVTLSGGEHKLLVTLQPQGGKTAIEMSADEFALPIGGDLNLVDFSATGTVTAAGLVLRKVEGRALGGHVLGNARMTWSDGWTLDGELEARQMSPARFAPRILSGDALQGKGVYSMKALVPDRLFMNARLEGNFTIQKGSISNVDMMRMLQGGGSGGGTTVFTEMSGLVSADPERIAVRQLRIVAGLMNAAGQVEMDPEMNLSGRVAVELRAATVQARTSVTVSGTLQDPQFRGSN
jgi:hypothetical protein